MNVTREIRIGTFGGTSSVAFGISGQGEVVGRADVSGSPIRHAFKFDFATGQIEDLHDAALSSPGPIMNEATGINDNGQICANTNDGSGTTFGLVSIP